MNTPPPAQFANPKLATIATSAEFKTRISLIWSLLYDAISWLVIPAGVLFVIVALIMFELAFFPMCPFDDMDLISFIGYSLARIGCGSHPLGTPIYMFLKVSLLSGSYLIVAAVFFRARRNAKRYRANALGSLARDARAPVLYLRSFAIDESANPDRRSLKTHEEDLALALRHIGPVVAVGEPNEKLPLLGATRIYMKQDNWQQNIESLMSISRLVVIHAGLSDGLIWEIETAVRVTPPSRIIISFLSWTDLDEAGRIVRYHNFKKRVSQLLKQSDLKSTLNLPTEIGDASFLGFTDDGKPELVRTGKWKKLFFRFSSSVLMNETLRPLLLRRGLTVTQWKTVPYTIYIVVMFLGLMNMVMGVTSAILMGLGVFQPAPERLDPGILVIPTVFVTIWLLANLIKYIFNLITKRRQKYTLMRISE